MPHLTTTVTASTTQEMCFGFYVEERSHYIMTAVVCVTAMTVPFVLLRLFSRMSVGGKLWWDDVAMIVAAVI
jgi:hypothetical protein